MPMYDFTCMTCDKTTEMHMAFDATTCPICDKCGNFMIKAYTPPAIHFRGGGWGGK
jgi:putative FmdB family regulatory protein